MTARQQVVDAITPALPKSWKVVPYLTSFDNLDQTVVMVHATAIARFEAQPALWQTTFEATVLDPSKDPARVWDSLDDEVFEAVHALDTIPGLLVTGAEPVAISNLFGWNITFSVPNEQD